MSSTGRSAITFVACMCSSVEHEIADCHGGSLQRWDVPHDVFDERVAATYDLDRTVFDPAVVDPVVDFLAELAGDGNALELGIGTGRIALPLSARGIRVHGIDISEAMIAKLREKPGSDAIEVTVGDFATTRIDGAFRLAYVVYNTI